MSVVRNRPYQRRRRGPVIAVVTVLAVLAVATWATVLLGAGGADGSRTCPAVAQGPAPGASLAPDALDTTAPTAPGAVRVTVLNAGGQRGQANLVAAQLGDLGFAEAAPPSNDPFYPDGDMECVGQVRFGPAGETAAGTVALVLPCAELVRDTRADDSVDVSVGTAFGDLNPPGPVRDVLEALTAAATPTEDGSAPPTVDPADVEDARDAGC